jgi:hypothetical protein
MSLPLYGCTLLSAIKGDDEKFKTVVERLTQPAFTYVPCGCDPKCTLPNEAITLAFFDKIDKESPKASKKLLLLMTSK